MLRSTLDDLISQEAEGLCKLIKELDDTKELGTIHVYFSNIREVRTRLEQLIKERKNAR